MYICVHAHLSQYRCATKTMAAWLSLGRPWTLGRSLVVFARKPSYIYIAYRAILGCTQGGPFGGVSVERGGVIIIIAISPEVWEGLFGGATDSGKVGKPSRLRAKTIIYIHGILFEFNTDPDQMLGLKMSHPRSVQPKVRSLVTEVRKCKCERKQRQSRISRRVYIYIYIYSTFLFVGRYKELKEPGQKAYMDISVNQN